MANQSISFFLFEWWGNVESIAYWPMHDAEKRFASRNIILPSGLGVLCENT